MGLPLQAKDKMTVHVVKTHWLTNKERMPGAAVSNEGHSDSRL